LDRRAELQTTRRCRLLYVCFAGYAHITTIVPGVSYATLRFCINGSPCGATNDTQVSFALRSSHLFGDFGGEIFFLHLNPLTHFEANKGSDFGLAV